MSQDERRGTRRLAGALALAGMIAALMYSAVARLPITEPGGTTASAPHDRELGDVASDGPRPRQLAPSSTSPGPSLTRGPSPVSPKPSRPAGDMERARSGAAGAAGFDPTKRPPIQVDDVSDAAALEYMARSAPNPRARDALSNGYLKRLRDTHGLHFTEAVECRGSICKTVLVFDDPRELAKLGGIAVDAEAEFTYRLDIEKKPRELTLLSTERGTTFAELLGTDEPAPQ